MKPNITAILLVTLLLVVNAATAHAKDTFLGSLSFIQTYYNPANDNPYAERFDDIEVCTDVTVDTTPDLVSWQRIRLAQEHEGSFFSPKRCAALHKRQPVVDYCEMPLQIDGWTVTARTNVYVQVYDWNDWCGPTFPPQLGDPGINTPEKLERLIQTHDETRNPWPR